MRPSQKILPLSFVLLSLCGLTGCAQDSPIQIKALILPKFEIGEMSGDGAGEAQYYYEAYCQGGKEYESKVDPSLKIYVKDGVALSLLGMGKAMSVTNLNLLLSDDRFDFSDAYLLSTGCAGGAIGYATIGDVSIATATVDFELGYHADARDLGDSSSPTWYHDSDYDASSYIPMDENLVNKVYQATKDVALGDDEASRATMAEEFDNAEWAIRSPKVILGTSVTADSYWKGEHDHDTANYICEQYQTKDPYATTEMEDNALAYVAKKWGKLDHFLSVRDIVNVDVFVGGYTPESLWGEEEMVDQEDSKEAFNIFSVAMENNFKVGKIIIDKILSNAL